MTDPAAAQPHPAPRHDGAGPQLFVFLMLERFSLLSFAGAVEPLRIANRMAGQTLYRWRLVGEGGEAMSCSNGVAVRLDAGLDAAPDDIDHDATVLVCGGLGVQEATTRTVLNWLRRVARRGAAVGGLCTAAHTLARAGLLDGRTATIHWENQDGFLEDFDEVTLTKAVFVADGMRMTTAGGTASVDLMLKLEAAFNITIPRTMQQQLQCFDSIANMRSLIRLSTMPRKLRQSDHVMPEFPFLHKSLRAVKRRTTRAGSGRSRSSGGESAGLPKKR